MSCNYKYKGKLYAENKILALLEVEDDSQLLIHEHWHPFQIAIRQAAENGDEQAKAFQDRIFDLALQQVKDNLGQEQADAVIERFKGRVSESKEEATKRSVNFFTIGQKGAMALDKLEGAFNRLQRLKEAKQLEAKGKEPLYIKYLTGWERQDGKWKMEIEDYNDIKTTPEQILNLKEDVGKITTIKELLNNKDAEILKAFPSIGNVYVRYDSELTEGLAHYDPANNEIVFYRGSLDRPIDTIKGTLVHEIQHTVQSKEGFEFGADLETAKQLAEIKNISEYEAYRRSIGETEARNSQKRMLTSATEKLLTLLDDTADVAPEDRISLREIAQETRATANELGVEKVATFIEELLDNPAYDGLTGTALMDELVTTIVGRVGAEQIQDKTFLEKLKTTILEAIVWLAEKFNVSLKDKTADEILQMNLGELVSAGLGSARKGDFLQDKIKNARIGEVTYKKVDEQEETINITEYNPETKSIVATVGDKLVGRLQVKEESGDYIADSIVVYDNYKRKGIGKELMLTMIDHIDKEGKILHSTPTQSPAGNALWENLVELGIAQKVGDMRYMALPDKLKVDGIEPIDIANEIETLIQKGEITRNCKL